MQTNSAPGGHLPEFHYESAEAAHTEKYLWRHIIALCSELRARRILDSGCGNGALCRELARHGYEVVGCEPSPDGVRFAQSSAPELVFHQLAVDDDPGAIGMYLEQLTSSLYLDKRSDVEHYAAVMDRLCAQVEPPDRTAGILRAIRDEI